MADEEKKNLNPVSTGRELVIPNGSTKYEEEELGAYLHLKIEEKQQPDRKLEKAIIPDAVRKKKFWRRFHTQTKVFASRSG